MDKPKAPKKPLKNQPKPSETEFLLGVLYEKNNNFVLVFDPVQIAKDFPEYDDYTKDCGLLTTKKEIAWQVLVEIGYESVHKLTKKSMLFILDFAEKEKCLDFEVEGPSDDYAYGPRGSITVFLKKKTEVVENIRHFDKALDIISAIKYNNKDKEDG